MQAKLIVVGGRASKDIVQLKLPATIGRSRDATITVAHSTVSRYHCEIVEVDGALVVRDNNSLNGTFVEEERITECVLRPGAKLAVGPLTFQADYEHDGEYPLLAALDGNPVVDTSPVDQTASNRRAASSDLVQAGTDRQQASSSEEAAAEAPPWLPPMQNQTVPVEELQFLFEESSEKLPSRGSGGSEPEGALDDVEEVDDEASPAIESVEESSESAVAEMGLDSTGSRAPGRSASAPSSDATLDHVELNRTGKSPWSGSIAPDAAARLVPNADAGDSSEVKPDSSGKKSGGLFPKPKLAKPSITVRTKGPTPTVIADPGKSSAGQDAGFSVGATPGSLAGSPASPQSAAQDSIEAPRLGGDVSRGSPEPINEDDDDLNNFFQELGLK